MKTYKELTDNRMEWNNTVIIINKVDYNEMMGDDEDEWKDELKEIEIETITII